ncbi:MAG: ECF-type sigma factor [Candidatus Dormibacteraeota bacterium]|nr:ECF-type sigma factor [Candidatus Dormibacteraeota bacterium]
MPWFATHSWRAWLMTGARKVPIDRRRARGSDAHVKTILMGGPSGAVDFSSAMARQAIDEAMNELPYRDRQVVKLAYFGGLTNREIAEQLSLTPGGVRRCLRVSLATISAYVSRGRATARSAIHGLVLWLYLRRFGGGAQRPHGAVFSHIQQAGIVAVLAVAAAALVVTHQASPGRLTQPHTAHPVAVAGSVGLVLTVVRRMSPHEPVAGGVSPLAALPSLPPKLHVPVHMPISLPALLPALPSLPVKVQVPAPLPASLPAHLPALPSLPVKLQVPARLPISLPAHLPALPSLPVKLRTPARLRISLPAHLPAVPAALKLASAL